MTTTADDVWRLLGELIESQKENEHRFQNLEQKIKNIENKINFKPNNEGTFNVQEKDEEIDDIWLKELAQQIRNATGGRTDDFALPSMREVLYEQFDMRFISAGISVTRQEENLEIDVFAYNDDKAYIVEVKSHAQEDSIDQLKNILGRFHHFFPEHGNKQVYGILTTVDMSSEVRKKALKEGLYVARIHDDLFKMDTPKDFQPLAW